MKEHQCFWRTFVKQALIKKKKKVCSDTLLAQVLAPAWNCRNHFIHTLFLGTRKVSGQVSLSFPILYQCVAIVQKGRLTSSPEHTELQLQIHAEQNLDTSYGWSSAQITHRSMLQFIFKHNWENISVNPNPPSGVGVSHYTKGNHASSSLGNLSGYFPTKGRKCFPYNTDFFLTIQNYFPYNTELVLVLPN